MQQRSDHLLQLPPPEGALSRYIRSCWMLCAQSELEVHDDAVVRLLSASEADMLVEATRKRNVFARHSWENSFYLQRIKELSDRTVIEVLRPGDPDDMISEAEQYASTLEKLAVLSTSFSMPRHELQRRLGIGEHRGSVSDITIGRDFKYLRSKSKPERLPQGIVVNQQFVRRFARCGFPTLLSFCVTTSAVASRVCTAVDWLFESRLEPVLTAAVVKTATALESLLIFGESESIASSLSERSAFILTPDAEIRGMIGRLVKDFYSIRSGVVHGNRKRAAMLSSRLLDIVDRVVLMVCLIIASNPDKWSSQESLREWSELQRWGSPSTDVIIPFHFVYLKNVLTMHEKL